MAVDLIGCRLWTPKSGHFIRPASAFDEDKLATVKEGQAVHVVITTPDQPRLRQFYRGLLALLVRGGVWAHTDAAHLDLMVKTGRVEKTVINSKPGGEITVRFEPKSTADWGGPEWRSFLDDVVPIITSEFIPEIPWRDVRADAERYVGIRLRDALQEAS